MKLLKILSAFNERSNIDYKKQKEFLDLFPEPKDDYERTDNNIQCQRLLNKNNKTFLYDLFALFGFPFLFLMYIFNSAHYKKKDHIDTIVIIAGNRAGEKYNYRGRLPVLSDSFGDIAYLEFEAFPIITKGIADKDTIKLVWHFITRHPFSFFVNTRAMINIMGFNYLLKVYSPNAIFNSRVELNSMSSLVTHVCELKDCAYICFMHGESLFNIRYAFHRFSKFFIWDDCYKKIFQRARCEVGEYIVYTPGIRNIEIDSSIRPNFFITYYLLGDERTRKEKNIIEISRILENFDRRGKKCKVRPHPRWSDYDEVVAFFTEKGIEVENPVDVSVKDSILSSEYVIGTSSSVLAEAYYMKKKVIIDDISDPTIIAELKERMYFLLDKDIILLSSFINSMND